MIKKDIIINKTVSFINEKLTEGIDKKYKYKI